MTLVRPRASMSRRVEVRWGDADVDVLPGQGLAYIVGIVTGDRKTHNATAFSP